MAGEGRSELRDGCDPVGVDCVLLAERDIFARTECFVLEMEASFVRFGSGNVVMESPASAWPVDQVATYVLSAGPQARDAASLPVRFPCSRVDMIVRVERRSDHITDVSASVRMCAAAGEFEAYPAERCRQAAVSDGFENVLLHQKIFLGWVVHDLG